MYDIIGDIHGYAGQLRQLLKKMEYQFKGGTFVHPSGRQAVFVGDFIDRGPQVRECLKVVKGMCDANSALAVMGNHEYNALCFHAKDPQTGDYFRPHTSKNIAQHQETLGDFKHRESEWGEFLEWFKELPLYLDLQQLRVVHACWDNDHIKWIDNHYNGISTSFLQKVNGPNKDQQAYQVIEETLKGKEYPLPEGITFKDKGGKVRRQCRIRWWSRQRNTFKDVLIECPEELAEKEITSDHSFYAYREEKPVFFGHYWLKGAPRREHAKAICLDYSVAQEGKLVAFRWNGPDHPHNQFIY